MPFTFSHPSAVLPFLTLPQKWRSATGLIIGSMAPDFEKFIRMSDYDPYSHTWRSLLYFNLPLGLLLAFVFHLLVRDALIKNLPTFLQVRFTRYMGFNWLRYFNRHYPVVMLSILVGAASHLAWDSFTHDGGLGVRLFPVLKTEIFSSDPSWRIYALLQKITSVVGGAGLLYLILLLPKGKKVANARPLKFWGTLAVVAVAMVGVRWLLGEDLEMDNLYNFSIVAISAGLTSLILTPVLLRVRYSNN